MTTVLVREVLSLIPGQIKLAPVSPAVRHRWYVSSATFAFPNVFHVTAFFRFHFMLIYRKLSN